jgi:DNA-binding response OmpR family regulator
MESTTSILLCEEDAPTREFIADNLLADGYRVLVAETKAAALAALEARQPDLVICDVNGDTLGLLDAVRHGDGVASRIDPDVPLIVLTTRGDELARVRFLERGGDDVVTKPFGYPELRARVRALLRRSEPRRRRRVIAVGALRIDTVAREVRVGEETVEMPAREYALLTHLASEPRRVFTKRELLRDLWGFRDPVRTRTLDSHACRLRQRLTASGDARWIQNVWGVGYRLAALDRHEREGSEA